MTVAYPDVLEMVRKVVQDSNGKIKNFIIDSELIAYDIPNDRILPFQALTQRSRKHVNEKDLETKIAI
jgi:DNA ligase-1